MNKKVFLFGGGGHAKVLMDMLNSQGIKVEAIVSPKVDSTFLLFKDIIILSDNEVLNYDPDEIVLVNGVGCLPGNSNRAAIFKKFRAYSYNFLTIQSKDAIVSDMCNLGMGVQVMPGAIINANAFIGDNTIINSGAIIEHDCMIGKNNHIAPGAVLCGNSSTKDNVHIGTGASIIQNITIEENAVIAAGTSIVRDVEKNILCRPANISSTNL